jgi:hypothetical protein
MQDLVQSCLHGGGGDIELIGGHVLRETTSRGLYGLVCPSRTSERGGSASSYFGATLLPRRFLMCVMGFLMMCVFITAGPSTKLWGGGDMAGHVLREAKSRGRCGLGCPSRTSERGGVCLFNTAGPSSKLFALGGGGIWEDMCYERRRAEDCMD